MVIKRGVMVEAMVIMVAFDAVDLSGNLRRGTAGGRDSENVAGTSSYLRWTTPSFHRVNVHSADLRRSSRLSGFGWGPQ